MNSQFQLQVNIRQTIWVPYNLLNLSATHKCFYESIFLMQSSTFFSSSALLPGLLLICLRRNKIVREDKISETAQSVYLLRYYAVQDDYGLETLFFSTYFWTLQTSDPQRWWTALKWKWICASLRSALSEKVWSSSQVNGEKRPPGRVVHEHVEYVVLFASGTGKSHKFIPIRIVVNGQ